MQLSSFYTLYDFKTLLAMCTIAKEGHECLQQLFTKPISAKSTNTMNFHLCLETTYLESKIKLEAHCKYWKEQWEQVITHISVASRAKYVIVTGSVDLALMTDMIYAHITVCNLVLCVYVNCRTQNLFNPNIQIFCLAFQNWTLL